MFTGRTAAASAIAQPLFAAHHPAGIIDGIKTALRFEAVGQPCIPIQGQCAEDRDILGIGVIVPVVEVVVRGKIVSGGARIVTAVAVGAIQNEPTKSAEPSASISTAVKL